MNKDLPVPHLWTLSAHVQGLAVEPPPFLNPEQITRDRMIGYRLGPVARNEARLDGIDVQPD